MSTATEVEVEETLELFITQMEFLSKIEDIKIELGCNYIDAVVQFCKESNYDILDVVPYVGDALRTKLYHDAYDLHLLVDVSPRLPI